MEKAGEFGITLSFLPPYSYHRKTLEVYKKQILYAKYHDVAKDFFDTINDKCYDNLMKLMSLDFRFFEQKHNSLN
jgi:hypothetical protein